MTLRAVVTPLHRAVINQSLSEMRSLLDHGMSPDIHETQIVQGRFDIEGSLNRFQHFGCTNLFRATNTFDLLLNQVIRDPVVIERGGLTLRLKPGMTPIFLAIMLNFEHGFQLLLDKGASINVRDNDRNTPLHYAACSVDFVKQLLDRGADLDVMNIKDQTPIYFAVEKKCQKTLSLLIEKGARIDTKDVTGATLLHVAVKIGFDFGTELLLEKGIEVNVRDNLDNQTPIFLAIGRKDLHVFRLLIEKGASVKSYKITKDYNVGDWLDELRRLKTVKYGHLSLYDLFTQSKYGDPVIVCNTEISTLVHSPTLKTEFPNYALELKKHFILAAERHILMIEAQQFLPNSIPKEIRRMILSYLSNEDLSKFKRGISV